jgi:hypothetical protein
MKKLLSVTLFLLLFSCISSPTPEEHKRKNLLIQEAKEVLDIDNKNSEKIAIAGKWKQFHINGYLSLSLFNCHDIEHAIEVFRKLNQKHKLRVINLRFYSKYRDGQIVSEEKVKEVTIRKGKH